ncbi:MAG: MFS transporter [Candidatus Bathyarchaeia archaeon]
MEAEEGKASFWSGNLGIMMLSSGLWRIGGRMTGPFWALYVLQLGGDYFHIGLITAVSSIFSLMPAFFGGYLADAIGRKKVIYSMSLLMALNTVTYLLAPSWEWLLIGRSMDAIFGAIRQPAFTALLGDSTRAERRSMSYGMWQAIPPIFGLASPYIIGILMDRYGVLRAQRWAYLILLISSGLAAFLRYRYLTETLPAENRVSVSYTEVLRETLENFRETFGGVSGQMWILILMGVLYQLGASIGGIYMVTYATEDVIHLSSSQWGLINTASMLVGMIVSIPFAAVADRFGRVKTALLSLFITPLAIIGFIYSGNFLQTFASYIALTVLGNMGSVASQALFIDFSRREHRGRISALTSIVGATQNFNFQIAGANNVASAVGNVVGGMIYEDVSYSFPFFIMAGTIGTAAIIGTIYVREPEAPDD